MMNADETYMQRAMDLAILGLGSVNPNPMVGCVIVHDHKIIGEGWHKANGMEHAEVNALNQVEDRSLLPESTMYVTLEPCAHHGKTPPCANRIIQEKLGRVVVAIQDSNPLVSGKGIERMKDAGINVEVGCLQSKARSLNKRFFTYHENGRPYVILKWAQTSDGFIARSNYESKWISNVYSRKLVHKWRTEEDAILIGANTARIDNPQLTARDWIGKNPVRVVIDKTRSLGSDLNIFDRSVPTLCFNLVNNETHNNLDFIKLPEENFLISMLLELKKREIISVLVEGGSKTLNSFIRENLWDESRVFISKDLFGKGIGAPEITDEKILEMHRIDDNELKIYKNG